MLRPSELISIKLSDAEKRPNLSFRGRFLPEESAFCWILEKSGFLAALEMTYGKLFQQPVRS
jgi:hypothetical protein